MNTYIVCSRPNPCDPRAQRHCIGGGYDQQDRVRARNKAEAKKTVLDREPYLIITGVTDKRMLRRK